MLHGAEDEFNELKRGIADVQICIYLSSPDESYMVTVDASDIEIAAKLYQTYGAIEYASKLLTTLDRKYSTIEEKCLAVFWTLVKWRTH